MGAGRTYTAGIDEVGMGPIAGPAIFGIVILEDGILLPDVRDSKKLSDKQKYVAATQVMENSKATYTHRVTETAIDIHGMGKMWQEAMRMMVAMADAYQVHRIVVDGNRRVAGVTSKIECLVKADDLVLAVSAASVLAKCEQIMAMEYLNDMYPEYGFAVHHGYGTPDHIEAIKRLGAVKGVHRKKYTETLAKNKGFTVRWREGKS
jgi:ribonuclease HII